MVNKSATAGICLKSHSIPAKWEPILNSYVTFNDKLSVWVYWPACDPYVVSTEPSHESWTDASCSLWKNCAAEAESTGSLTDAYLTFCIFKVLYFYLSYSNCNIVDTTERLFIHFSCLSVPWCIFFKLWNHFDILEFSLFSITFVNAEMSFKSPSRSFCGDIVCYEK